jgi:hypothetical protein
MRSSVSYKATQLHSVLIFFWNKGGGGRLTISTFPRLPLGAWLGLAYDLKFAPPELIERKILLYVKK